MNRLKYTLLILGFAFLLESFIYVSISDLLFRNKQAKDQVENYKRAAASNFQNVDDFLALSDAIKWYYPDNLFNFDIVNIENKYENPLNVDEEYTWVDDSLTNALYFFYRSIEWQQLHLLGDTIAIKEEIEKIKECLSKCKDSPIQTYNFHVAPFPSGKIIEAVCCFDETDKKMILGTNRIIILENLLKKIRNNECCEIDEDYIEKDFFVKNDKFIKNKQFARKLLIRFEGVAQYYDKPVKRLLDGMNMIDTLILVGGSQDNYYIKYDWGDLDNRHIYLPIFYESKYEFPKSLFDSPFENTKVLAIQSLSLKEIPEGVFKDKKVPLEMLYIKAPFVNNIERIKELKDLKHLVLYGMRKDFDYSFLYEMKNIESLTLCYTTIDQIDERIFNLPNLKKIYLKDNPVLQSFPYELFDKENLDFSVKVWDNLGNNKYFSNKATASFNEKLNKYIMKKKPELKNGKNPKFSYY